MKVEKTLNVILFLFLISFSIVSCIDEQYDLNNEIDLTIQAGGKELVLPIGSTTEIKLADVLELGEDDLIQTDADGNYYLLKEGVETESQRVSVETFTAAAPDQDEATVHVDFYPEIKPIKAADQKWIGVVKRGECHTNFQVDVPDKNGNEIPKEIISVSHLDVSVSGDVNIYIEQSFAKRVRMDNVKIKVPNYFKAEELNDSSEIVLQNIVLENGIPYTQRVNVTAADFTHLTPEQGTGIQNGEMHLLGEVELYGNFSYHTSDLIYNPQEPKVNVTLQSTFSDLRITAMTGIVDPEININIDPVTITGVPDFLLEDDVLLDIENPRIYFSLWNQSPLNILFDGTLTAFRQGEQMNPEFPIVCNTRISNQETTDGWNYLCLAEKEPDNLEPKWKWVETTNLSKVIEHIPDEIRFDVNAQAEQKETTIELGKEYGVTTNYKIEAPFIFGKDFKIVYQDSINGWKGNLDKYGIKKVNVDGVIENKIPLELKLTAEATGEPDANGNIPVLPNVTAVVKTDKEDGIISPNTKIPFTIELLTKNPEDIQQLDGIIYHVEGLSNTEIAGSQLNENQTLKLTDIKLRVIDGITIDLNK